MTERTVPDTGKPYLSCRLNVKLDNLALVARDTLVDRSGPIITSTDRLELCTIRTM
jgi:hypothetical protein